MIFEIDFKFIGRGKKECITIEEDGCSVNNYTVNPIALKNILKN